MKRPPLDLEQMRSIARRIAKADSKSERKLRGFLDGSTTPADALPTFREVLRELIEANGQVEMSRSLRADIYEWVAKNGPGRESPLGEATSRNVPTRYPLDLLEEAQRCADLAGKKFSVYVREAVAEKVERDQAAQGIIDYARSAVG